MGPRKLHGFGTLVIGTKQYAEIKYQVEVRRTQHGLRAMGVITGPDEALREASNTEGVHLELEDGRLARIIVSLPAEGRADVRVIGSIADRE